MVTHATRVRRYKHLIGGEWLDSSSGEVIPRDYPATGEKVAEFAAGNPDDTRRAIAAARVAFDRGPWPRMSGMERSKLLHDLARRIGEEAESLARIEVEEVGKTIRFARGDVGGTVGIFEYAAGLAPQVLGYIRRGEEEGAHLLTGGDNPPGDERGTFVAPTVFDRVGRTMTMFREEIFGPVLSVTRFASAEEAVELANDTEFGLANSLWTKDLDKAMTVSRDLQAGRIWVNTTIDGGPQLPAGGYKASGFGREMGYAGLEEFTEIKSILYRLGKREPYFGSDWSR